MWVSFFYGSNAWILTGETEWRLSLRLLKQMTRSLPIVGRWRAWERYEKGGGLGGIPRMSCRKLEKVSSPQSWRSTYFTFPRGGGHLTLSKIKPKSPDSHIHKILLAHLIIKRVNCPHFPSGISRSWFIPWVIDIWTVSREREESEAMRSWEL